MLKMKRFCLSLCAFGSGGVLLLNSASGQDVPKPMPGAKAAPQAKDRPAAKPADAPKPMDTEKPRDTQKPRDTDKPRNKAQDKDVPRVTGKSDEAKDDIRDRTKPARRDAKDRTRETRGDAEDRTRDAGDEAEDKARDRTRPRRGEAGDADARDTDARDARDTDAPDRAGDDRPAGKSARGDAQQARKFDVEKVQVNDLGLKLEEADEGIAVSNIERNSVFTDAGFRSGDQIVSINGQNIRRQNDFVRYLFAPDVVRVGRVPVIVMRDGTRETVYVQPARIIRSYETIVYQGRSNPIREFGLVVDTHNDDRVYVERVIKDSRADHAGISVDDEIVAVNEQEVETRDDLAHLLEKYEAERVEMEVRREREAKVIDVDIR